MNLSLLTIIGIIFQAIGLVLLNYKNVFPDDVDN